MRNSSRGRGGVAEPRLVAAPPTTGLEPGGADDLLPGDALEGRDVGDLDIAGRRLADLDVEECVFGTLVASDADLVGLRIRDTTIAVLDAPVFKAARSRWNGVRVDAGRVGSAELYDANIDDVRFRGVKFGFVNLRASVLQDVVFEDCTIDALALDDARLTRVAFPGTRIREWNGVDAQLRDVDLRAADIDELAEVTGLRGATIDGAQALRIAGQLAVAAGLLVED